jgi:aarF domain-containing kinase
LRSAHRVLVALQENGGLYIKLGQHLSSIILLPPEWTNTMKPLQDQNTPTPLPEMEAMFRSETGRTFSEAFSEIDAKPIGVASLAQVHRAVDRQTGQQLAIKLMHPQVERFSQVDMQTVNVLVRWVKRAFPDFEFTWLAEEMNENMPLEMDFRHEAGNSRRAAEDFAQYRKTSVYIPKVPWVYKRVMAMEFVDGRRPDDLQYLSDHHIDRNRVSQELSRAFSQMLYMHGFFHADPHGGNVLIRPAPKGSRSPFNFEVVLLDHGLYFDISQDLRTNYARFWLALLSKSTPKVMAERRRLAKSIANIDDDLYHILESAITGRSGLEGSDDKNPNGVGGGKRKSSLLDLDSGSEMTDEEQEHIRKTVMEKEGLFIDILKVLRQVPRRMLMVLKLNDLARSLDANLHTTHGHARPFIITARYCALAVWKDDRQSLRERWQKEGFSFRLVGDWISSWANYIYFYRGLSFFEALSDMNASRRKIFSFSSAFAKSANLLGARRAMSGVDSQTLSRQKEQADSDRAREQIKVQDDDAKAEGKGKKY